MSSVSSRGHRPVSNSYNNLSTASAEFELLQPPLIGSQIKVNGVNGSSEVIESAGEATDIHSYEPNIPRMEGLRDIAEASFDRVIGIEEVIGPDNRQQILNTRLYPWSAIASLQITAADDSIWHGTGWFIGPRTLITAGHCVFTRNSGWVKSILVMPGRNGSDLFFGSVVSTNFISVSNWINEGNTDYDYGAIFLPIDLGNSVGAFGFGVYSDVDLRGALGNISGYPTDKTAGTQWFDTQQITNTDARNVYYEIDTRGGQSGSPVFRIVNNNRIAVAIHTYDGFGRNSGTRITNAVYNNLMNWRMHSG